MRRHFPVSVGPAFPRIDGGKVRRVELGDPPLQLREIGDARQSDLAAAPGLRARPFDRVVEILRFFRGQIMRRSFRIPGAAHVNDDDRVAARDPEHRIGRFERRVFRGIALLHAGIEKSPRIERHMLAVGRPGDDRRHRALVGGPENIGVKLDAVAHRDGDVALDDHRVLILEDASIDRRLAAALLGRVARRTIAILIGLGRHLTRSAASHRLILSWVRRPSRPAPRTDHIWSAAAIPSPTFTRSPGCTKRLGIECVCCATPDAGLNVHCQKVQDGVGRCHPVTQPVALCLLFRRNKKLGPLVQGQKRTFKQLRATAPSSRRRSGLRRR